MNQSIISPIADSVFNNNPNDFDFLFEVMEQNPASVYYEIDGILISSYTHHKSIYEKLLKKQYDVNKIIQFFD